MKFYWIIDDNVFFKILQNGFNLTFATWSDPKHYDTLMGVDGGYGCNAIIRL